MLILHATTDIIRVVTDSAADVEPAVSVMETDNATPPVIQDIPNLGTLASITTATTTTIADCTTANRRRNIKHISLYNHHASQATTCRVEFSDGTLVSVLMNVSLLAGELLLFDGARWIHYDSNGGIYPSVGNRASQAEMEAGTATDKYVTPQGVNWHPGAAKFWVKAGVTGNVLASWNVTSLTDTGTGVLTITIGTDFSTVDYCCLVAVEATATTWAVANTRECHIRSATIATGSIAVDCVDNTATTSLVKDPTTWHVAAWGDQA